MITFVKKISASKGLQQSLTTIVGNILATGISAISLILISRTLGPEKFGAFNIGFALVLIIIKFNDFGISAATLRLAASQKDRDNINTVFSLALSYKKYLTLAIVPLGIILSPKVAELIRFDRPEIIALAFLFGSITVYYEQLLVMLQSIHHFLQAVIVNAIQASTKLIMALVVIFLGTNNAALIFSLYILAPLSPLLLYKFLLPKWINLTKPDQPKFKKKLKNLSLHFSIALLSAGIIENIDVFFIQRSLNTYETGLYSGVARIATAFTLIAYSMGNVLYPRVAKYKSKEHLSVYLKKAAGVSALALLSFLLFLPISKWFIFFTIGPEYLSGLPFMNLLVLSAFLMIASIPFIALFYTFEATWYFSVSALVQLAIVLIGNFYFVPIYGLQASAWTKLTTRSFLFIFTALTGLIIYKKQYAKNYSQKNS